MELSYLYICELNTLDSVTHELVESKTDISGHYNIENDNEYYPMKDIFDTIFGEPEDHERVNAYILVTKVEKIIKLKS